MSHDPSHYFNRELSLLKFHQRVLHQCLDNNLPLLERLNFLCIASTNLDEFFEVRIGALKERFELGSSTPPGPDGLTPEQTLTMLSKQVQLFVKQQYDIFNQQILPALNEQKVFILKREQWQEQDIEYLSHYFDQNILPLLTPIGLDPAHPFPRILNKSLNFIVQLSGKDAFGRNSGNAIVQVPRSLPNLIELPDQTGRFVLISSVIHNFMNDVFNGMTIKNCCQFRLTRNSDINLDEEETDDLLIALQGELAYRQYGDEVRLEIADNCPEDLITLLLARCQITKNDLYVVDGPVNLNRFGDLYGVIKAPNLYYPALKQSNNISLKTKRSLFEKIKNNDVLLHHPYNSFLPIVEFVRQAAIDPDVLSIKQTLYRTGSNSSVVEALIAAAKAGKEVTVVVELRARFDEQENVTLAEQLQRYGIHVIFGVVGFKTHAKMLLVTRREKQKLRYYVHLGTGNYHPQTTSQYTDYGLLTSNSEIGEDVYRIFLQLSSLGKMAKMKALKHAPFTLQKYLLKKISLLTETALNGKKAHIIFKINALYQTELVDALYSASKAGVTIDLIVRGICHLRPQIKGLSENIKVRSIVGRFLEHSRVFYFETEADQELYCSSADLMQRNMYNRVEIAYPIKSNKLKQAIIEDLQTYLNDNTDAWQLTSTGEYERLTPITPEQPINAQDVIMSRWST